MEKEAARPRAVAKSATAFRTISEVSEELDVPQHVLRFWETKFPQVRPLKRGGGRRYYRPEDVALLRKIQRLLYSEGYTIKGVQRLLKDQRHSGDAVEAAEMLDGVLAPGLGGEDLAAADSGADDPSDEDIAAEPPEDEPEPPVVPMPPPQAAAPLPLLAPLPAAGGELPAWLRREFIALRAELADLRTVLRKAIR